MKWYKYLPIEYAEGMVTKGCIKLGLLSGYRDMESHGDAVGDHEENTQAIYSHDKDTKTSIDELNPLEKKLFNFGDAKIENFTFSNNRIEIKEHGNELISYCASRGFDREAMNRMSQENIDAGNEAYDACVEITDHVNFVKEVCKHLEKEHGFKYKGHGDCFYQKRLVHWTKAHNTPTWNLKDESYAYQNECRLVLTPPDGFRDSSIVICILEIKQYCRLYEVNT